MKLAATALTVGLATEALLLLLAYHGVWRESFPESLGSALWFFSHLPLILLLERLGVEYPPSAVGQCILFVLSAAWMTGVYYLLFRALARRLGERAQDPESHEKIA